MTIEDANTERSGMWLTAEDVATLWDELQVLRGIRYRAHCAAEGRMGASPGVTAPGWLDAAQYIRGEL